MNVSGRTGSWTGRTPTKQKLYNLTQNPISVHVLDLCDSDWSGDLLLHSQLSCFHVCRKKKPSERLFIVLAAIAESWIC